MKKALITGIAGQDGSYLSEYLLSLGYEVYGMIRRQSTPEHQESRINHLDSQIKTFYGDLSDQASLEKILKEVMPDEIYNLAAQSHVRISSDIPQYTVQINALGVLNLLEAYKNICPEAKFYQASSSEMFGNQVDSDGFQRLSTPMIPVSPYGCAKLFAYNITNHYKQAYKLKIYNGILFNHESPRRGSNFVTNKIVKAAVKISLGLQNDLVLGNLVSFRDWGHSKDYVRAMHKIVSLDEPTNIVVSTGITHSVEELCGFVFSHLGLDFKKYIKQDFNLGRPQELKYLKGDPSQILSLGWKPEYTFETMLIEMIYFWQQYYSKF